MSQAFDPVDVELGGKKYQLRFTMGALRRAQARLREIRGDKVSIFQLLSPKNKEQLSPDEIVVLFHQGMRHGEHQDLTEEQVDDMIDARQLDSLAEKLALAMGGEIVREKPEEEIKKERPLASSSPGATSGPSGESS
jgi:hypothetical protein